jgi:2-polyprenyl-3-methyl-5-hydroxy-6-metoxy-1,4-benzoquinol methylase
MDVKTHWEKVYQTKAPDAVSWYQPHLETSLTLIERAGATASSAIIDVGAGESTLADDLLSLEFQNITVLDISETAIDVCKKRMGAAANRVHWLVADVTRAKLEPGVYDIWHDRAVFHFLTALDQRVAYVIVSTFGPEGPTRCSGLEVMRYDAESLHGQFGKRFRLVESSKELHNTPFGTSQQFLYCYCRIK